MITWQVERFVAHTARGIYSVEKDSFGEWELRFRPMLREWPSCESVVLRPENDQDGNARDYPDMASAVAAAERHASGFEVQAKRAAGG